MVPSLLRLLDNWETFTVNFCCSHDVAARYEWAGQAHASSSPMTPFSPPSAANENRVWFDL